MSAILCLSLEPLTSCRPAGLLMLAGHGALVGSCRDLFGKPSPVQRSLVHWLSCSGRAAKDIHRDEPERPLCSLVHTLLFPWLEDLPTLPCSALQGPPPLLQKNRVWPGHAPRPTRGAGRKGSPLMPETQKKEAKTQHFHFQQHRLNTKLENGDRAFKIMGEYAWSI